MRRKIYLLPQPRRALQEIYLYSRREWGKTQAARYISGLRHHFETLGEREKLGLSRPWQLGSPVFKSRYERHLVFYRHRDADLEVGLIVHGSQDFARLVERLEDPF